MIRISFLTFLFFTSFLISFSQSKLSLVATNNCGVEDEQSFLIKGDNYIFPDHLSDNEKAKTCNFGGNVIYAFDQLDSEADYQLEVVYLSDAVRQQQIIADGNVVQAPVTLETGKVQRYLLDLPKRTYAYGQLVLIFEVLRGPNTVVSEVNLYSSNSSKPIPFEGDRKSSLALTKSYTVDTEVDVETELPVYSPIPMSVSGVYNPKMSLNGTWFFSPKPKADFHKERMDGDNQWKPITVPGEWAMQGFHVDSLAFAGYQTTFSTPVDWNEKSIKLRFDGVSSECVVYLNGSEIGSHLGGMTAFELDVTDEIKKGDNILALKVRNESLADMLGSLTQYAAHQLGGITRKVTLFAVPNVHITDLRIVTDFDDLYHDADLRAYLAITNTTKDVQKNIVARVSVPNLPVIVDTIIPLLSPGQTWTGWISEKVDNPKKWNSEQPHLYTLNVDLQEEGKVTQQIQKRFGFREVKVDGNQLLVNGKAVKLRGVCRHEVHPLTGRVLTADLQREDIELYRDANCNFIRTSHYPPGEEMLDICDELGMFVEVEAPVCWIGHHANENWQNLNYQDPKYYPYVLQSNMEMIHFNRNHPSVIFWSMANESYWNKEFAQIQEYVKKADPSRPHAFHDQGYGGFNNQGSTAPITNIHYPGPEGYKHAAKSDRPMVYGEYCHLNVYNRKELVTDPGVRSDWALALAPTWENMYKTEGALGGSIWSGIDDIFQMPNGDAVGYGAWGPIDGWRRPKPEYWDMKKIYSPIRIHTKALSPSNEFTIELENRFTFTDLKETKINWHFGDQKGVSFVSLAPGKSGVLSVDVADGSAFNELYLSFTDSRGVVVDEYLIPVGDRGSYEIPEIASIKTKLKTQKDAYLITGKDFSCEVSRSSGQIISLLREGQTIMNGGPWLMALPFTGGGVFPNHNIDTPPFNDICSDWTLTSIQATQEGNDVLVTVEGNYKEFTGGYELTINAAGMLSVTYSFDALADVDPRQWGLVFEASVEFDKTFWRRDGMWSVYPDDHISRPIGEAKLFYSGLPQEVNSRVKPSWSWSYDYNELGSNDFRSTRRNVYFAGLTNALGNKVTAVSNGEQHWRTWLEKDKLRFLVADFVTGGAELFLGSFFAPYRKPIKVGDTIEGKVVLHVE